MSSAVTSPARVRSTLASFKWSAVALLTLVLAASPAKAGESTETPGEAKKPSESPATPGEAVEGKAPGVAKASASVVVTKKLKPLPAAPPLDRKAVQKSVDRGVKFLLRHQNKNGSWGSAATNLWDIYSPAPGSQRSFQVASTALSMAGLIKVGGDSKAVKASIERAANYLLKRHAVRRIRADTLYNTWALAYALEGFAYLLDLPHAPERKKAIKKAAQNCVTMLIRYRFVEGGWGYYNFEAKTASPGPGSVCFTTATVLIAMHKAKAHGIKIPKKLVTGAMKVITLSKRPDNAFVYGLYLLYAQTMGINKVKGSLARTPVCLLAMDLWGENVPQKNMQKCLDDLERYGHFLRIARKYPFPHESWYSNSGYFCLYGYYYAAMCLPFVPKNEQHAHASRLAKHMMGMQESDGATWDYQLHNCHKFYGTGYALLTLGMCLEHASEAKPEKSTAAEPTESAAAKQPAVSAPKK